PLVVASSSNDVDDVELPSIGFGSKVYWGYKFLLTRFTAISLMGLISAVKEGLKKAMHSSGGMAFSFPKNAHRTSRF
ncbi:MAG: hypothetical protein VYE67_11310, partial [Planctomycetota bacterium]|nr:hypothetical protein [Planctomycetota bacterium]